MKPHKAEAGRPQKPAIAKRILWGAAAVVILFILYLGGRILCTRPLALKPGEQLQARWTVEPGIHRIGDPVLITLSVESAPKVRYQMPDPSAIKFSPLEMQSQSKLRREWLPGGERHSIQFRTISWETGRFTLPGPTFNYLDAQGKTHRYRVRPLVIAITSLLPVGRSRAELLKLPLKPIRGPVGLTPNYAALWWFIALAALTGLIYGIVRRYQKRPLQRQLESVAPVIAVEPAHQIALQRLAALETASYLSSGEFKRYYSELSEIARQYIEGRFQIKALEMTTEEFLAFIAANRNLKVQHQFLLQEFLRSSDLVKFAKFKPLIDQARQDLERIRQLVNETHPEPPFEAAALNEPAPAAT